MNRFVTLAAAGALLSGISLSALATEKSVEDKCKEQATKEMISKDKVTAYVKECVKKHTSMPGSMTPSSSGSGK